MYTDTLEYRYFKEIVHAYVHMRTYAQPFSVFLLYHLYLYALIALITLQSYKIILKYIPFPDINFRLFPLNFDKYAIPHSKTAH